MPKAKLDHSRLVAQVAYETRRHPWVERGLSVRGAVAMFQLARSLAELRGVEVDTRDLWTAGKISIPHRIKLSASCTKKPEEVVEEILSKVLSSEQSERKVAPRSEKYGTGRSGRSPPERLSRREMREMREMLQWLLDFRHKNPAGPYLTLYPQILRREVIRYSPQLARYLERRIEARTGERFQENNVCLIEFSREMEEILALLEAKGVLERSDELQLAFSDEAYAILIEDLQTKIGEVSRGIGQHSALVKSEDGDEHAGVKDFDVNVGYRDVSVSGTIRNLIQSGREPRELTRRDLSVYEKRGLASMDLVVALDASYSMVDGSKLTNAKRATVAVATALQGFRRDRLGVVVFRDWARGLAPLGSNPGSVFRSVINLGPDGYTNIGDAVRLSTEMLLREGRPGARKHLILISDGSPTFPPGKAFESAIDQVKRTRANNVTVSFFAILGGRESDVDFAGLLARHGLGKVYVVAEKDLPGEVLEDVKLSGVG